MSNLSKVAYDDLLAELHRRLEDRKPKRPVPLPIMDFQNVIEMCELILDQIMANKEDSRASNTLFLFNTVFETVYGVDVMDRIQEIHAYNNY